MKDAKPKAIPMLLDKSAQSKSLSLFEQFWKNHMTSWLIIIQQNCCQLRPNKIVDFYYALGYIISFVHENLKTIYFFKSLFPKRRALGIIS